MPKVFDVMKGGGEERPLDIHEYLIKHPASTFFMKMETDGPEESGIYSRDILVVDRAVEPEGGRVVIFASSGELMVDYHENVEISEEVLLWGTVVGLVRKF